MSSTVNKDKTYVILLRGVMPIGKNKVPMARLREALAKAEFKNVRTYIASGNALVDTDLPAKEVQARVHTLIKKHIGPDLVVIVRTGAQLQKVLDGNPFKQGYDPSRLFFASFDKPPPLQKRKELLKLDVSPDEIFFDGNTAYVFIPGPYVESKLGANYLEKQLGVSATMRNFNTMTKLTAMAT